MRQAPYKNRLKEGPWVTYYKDGRKDLAGKTEIWQKWSGTYKHDVKVE